MLWWFHRVPLVGGLLPMVACLAFGVVFLVGFGGLLVVLWFRFVDCVC